MKKDLSDILNCGKCNKHFGGCEKEGEGNDYEPCLDFFPVQSAFFEETEKGSRFVPLKLASYLIYKNKMVTLKDTGETFYFNDGIYHPNAEIKIKEQIQDILSEQINKHRIDEIINCIKIATYIDREKHELPKNIIPLKNGLLDLKTMELKPHNPDYFITNCLPIEYRVDASCDIFIDFLNQIVIEEEVPVIQEIFGYFLLRDYRFQKAFCFIGTGANGKSTLISMMIAFLGKENITSVSLQDIVGNRFASARLYQKYANIYPDLSDKALSDTAIFKMLTGGDNIPAELKHRHGFEFVNYAKLIWSANRLPKVKNDDSLAYFRRWIIINFPNRFEGPGADPELSMKLCEQSILSGVFNWALEGYKRLLLQNSFSHSKSTEETEEFYTRMSDPVKAFLMDCIADYTAKDEEMIENKQILRWKASGYVKKARLYELYVNYCQDKHIPAVANNVFSREILSHGHGLKASQAIIDDKREHVWEGIEVLFEELKKEEVKENPSIEEYGHDEKLNGDE